MTPPRKRDIGQEEFLLNVRAASEAPKRHGFEPQGAPLEDNPYFLWIIHRSILHQIGPRMAARRALATTPELFREWLRETPLESRVLAEGMTAIELVGPKDVPALRREMSLGQKVGIAILMLVWLTAVVAEASVTFPAQPAPAWHGGPAQPPQSTQPARPLMDEFVDIVEFMVQPFALLNWFLLVLLALGVWSTFKKVAKTSRAHTASVRARVKLCSIKGLMSRKLARKYADEVAHGCLLVFLVAATLAGAIYLGGFVYSALWFLDQASGRDWARALWAVALPAALFLYANGLFSRWSATAEAGRGLNRLAELLDAMRQEQREP